MRVCLKEEGREISSFIFDFNSWIEGGGGICIQWTGVLQWNAGMEHWNGALEWSTGMDWRAFE
jgi:hypothetical protein